MNSKKIFITVTLACLLSIIFIPILAKAALVNCQGSDCTLDMLTQVGTQIYSLIVNDIAAPLGTLAILIGAVLMMTSAGNPSMMGLGKKVFWIAVIGLTLALGTKVIINTIISATGYTGGPV